ncbi:type II toxin-antitoxin system RelE family toxin [Streptomyces xinghaiensis]
MPQGGSRVDGELVILVVEVGDRRDVYRNL